jgi:lipopolysaccharide transport system permease protein
MHRFQLAAEDIRDGAKLWHLSWALGWADVKLRYRGSVLGPFWLTLSFAIMIGAMGFLYANLFHTDIHSYLPYLTVSLLLWNYMSALISDGCTCFIRSDSLIKGTRMPFAVHAARNIARNTIILGHNVVVIVGVFIIMKVSITPHIILAIPGVILWLCDAFAISLLIGAFCARFRDVPQIVASVMQIAFFITPVMWQVNILDGHSRAHLLNQLNPFFYMLEIVRAPLLGIPLTYREVTAAVVVSGCICIGSAIGFARTRGRIAYWV